MKLLSTICDIVDYQLNEKCCNTTRVFAIDNYKEDILAAINFSSSNATVIQSVSHMNIIITGWNNIAYDKQNAARLVYLQKIYMKSLV